MTGSKSALLYRRWWLTIGFVLGGAVVVSSLVPGGEHPKIEGLDKLGHAGAYLMLMVWFAGLQPRRTWGWVASVLLFLGLALEVAQGAMHMHRTADARDMLANAAGVALGAMLAAAGAATWPYRLESWFARR